MTENILLLIGDKLISKTWTFYRYQLKAKWRENVSLSRTFYLSKKSQKTIFITLACVRASFPAAILVAKGEWGISAHCAFFYIFPQLKNDRKHQQLLGEIEHLKSEKDVAESKIRQLQLQMSIEEEEVSKAQEERDEYKAEVSKLQLEVEGLKAHVANNDNDNDNNDYDDDVVDDNDDDDDKMLQVARKCLRLSIPRYMTDLT